jgi:hypothetical protein
MRPLSFIGVCLTPVLLLLGAAGTPAAASTSVPVTIQDTVGSCWFPYKHAQAQLAHFGMWGLGVHGATARGGRLGRGRICWRL